MTPRALITAIGATAVAFAVVITSIGASRTTPASDDSTTSVAATASVRYETYAMHDPAWSSDWNEACEFAV